MRAPNPTVLVVGATGRFAGLVVPELVCRNASVRALVRDHPANVEKARKLGASEVATGDLRNRQSLESAVEGVDGVFHIGPAFAPDEAAMGIAMVEAASRAGVRKFVFSSVIQPTNTSLENHASKVPVEAALYSTNMEYTILHPVNFMQNIGAAWPSVVEHGIFSEPFPKTAKVARVDYRDVAELAAIALTEARLSYATLELCAGMHSREDIVSMMSEELGRPISAGEPTFGEWAANARLPYSDRQMHLLAKVHDHYAQFGLGGNSLTLHAALGREPRSLRSFIRELALQTAYVA
ncbi:NmrA/HSCARG family protein [Mesorhizobium sp. M00.F.Ca.ET.216.01.1.1]|uniref:NmrA/HSCARG family protein n=1 Tax=Mesorhizobium sp. M00.F.Ca.ET.216.01.1.1 TaxID=2500528 RepID=UPI000FDB44C0|nr:NmrA/HSCARG family protein [Mesorhizobium sp. M00.F.Ca.ET.216.01.1.1]TGQ31894.1 NmrA/HSCARG family protein [Mesorhizobium sp. M00.F.Ca.ET.216.01.1.1]TJW18117.1 MAG: NmrA/HSCARG family protein [Mesorhizobium sp.]TJW47532.1 MAG: NmrA/HSCARG family protein [Mesorhizobium sp.]